MDAFSAKGPDGITRSLSEHYDGMKDVEQDPYGAWLAIQNQAARIEALERQVKAADALAVAIERRMVDLGGFDNRFGLRKAMEDYYRATKEGGA